MPATQTPAGRDAFSLKRMVTKAAILIVVGLLFGWVYAWASPNIFPRDIRAGFKLGMAHGALMPMALPSLVIGKDVDIYAAHNAGRIYKLGYIVGINVCGLLFFGSAFWRPARKADCRGSPARGDDHRNQPR